MPFELNTLVARMPMPLTAPVGEDLVILGMATNNYIALDEVGRRIWDHLAEPLTVQALCARLATEYQGQPEQIATDVLGFLHEMELEGLVNGHGQAPAQG